MARSGNDTAVEAVARVLVNRGRLVVVPGAGTSIRPGIPSGGYLIERIRLDYPTAPRNASLEELLSFVGHQLEEPQDLHTYLNNFIPTRSRAAFPPYFPTFTHEYCAHLVEIGLLRYFISFNFDDLQETSLEEEIGKRRTHVVASRSEFEALAARTGEPCRPGECLVLKPHGTMSRRLTMRELPEGVKDFEPEKRSVLTTVLKDAVVVLLGFANYNQDFLRLLHRMYTMGLTKDIVIVDLSPHHVANTLPGDRPNQRVLKYEGDVDGFFREVASTVHATEIFSRLRPTRHAIRCLFFDLFSRGLTSPRNEPAYRQFVDALKQLPRSWFDERLYELELLIYLFKTRGLFIQLASADCLRVRAAFERCQEWRQDGQLDDEDLEPHVVLDRILNRDQRQVVDDAPVQGRLGRDGLNARWCFLTVPPELRCDSTEASTTFRQKFHAFCGMVADRYTEWLGDCLRRHGVNLLTAERARKLGVALQQELAQLSTEFDVDLSEPDVTTLMRFRSPQAITSRREFERRTSELLMSSWTHLRVATVSGEWLARRLQQLPPSRRTIDIVSNLDMFTSKGRHAPEETWHYLGLVRSLADVLNSIRGWDGTVLEWRVFQNYEHHMTIATEEPVPGDTKAMFGAIYFRRDGKNTSIAPVYLGQPQDVRRLITYFPGRTDEWTPATTHGRLFIATVKPDGVHLRASPTGGAAIETLVKYLHVWCPNLHVNC